MHRLAGGKCSSLSLSAMFFKPINLSRSRLRRGLYVFLSLFLMVSSTRVSFSRSQEVIDQIAAVVNDYVITLSDVKIAESFGLFDEEILTQEKDSLEILDWLINQKLIIGLTQESRSIEPEAVEAAYQSLLFKLGNEAVKTKLDLFGLQEKDLQAYLFEKILFQSIIEDRFGLAVRVSLREIEDYYREKFVLTHTDPKKSEPLPLMEVLEEIESAIKNEKIKTLVEEWLKNLRREADIQILLKS